MLDLTNRFARLDGPSGSRWVLSVDRPAEYGVSGELLSLGAAFVVVRLIDSDGRHYRVSGLREHIQIEVS